MSAGVRARSRVHPQMFAQIVAISERPVAHQAQYNINHKPT